MNSYLSGYEKYRGEFKGGELGSIISNCQGKTNQYGLHKLESRGELFVGAMKKVYEGMIVGIHSKPVDLNVNPTREKKLTNTRTTSKDEATKLIKTQEMTLERAIDLIKDDEMIEITPKSIRLRKTILHEGYRK